MECLHNDRRFWLVSIGLCLIAVGVAVGLKRMPRTVPYWQCSKMYKRYSQIEGIRATYIKDFRINDTLTIGVTLLEATDSEGWERLLKAFDASRDMQKRKTEAGPGEFGVWVRMAPKGHPEKKVEHVSFSNSEQMPELVAISFDSRIIGIFHTGNIEELEAVYCYNTDYMVKKSNHFIN